MREGLVLKPESMDSLAVNRIPSLGESLSDIALNFKQRGAMGLILIAFLILGGLAFGFGGMIPGTTTSVILFIALLAIRNWLIHRTVARTVRPRLQNLLHSSSLEWSELESALVSRELRFPRLRRHLKRGYYDGVRNANAFDEEIEPVAVGISEFLPDDTESPVATADSQHDVQPAIRDQPQTKSSDDFVIVVCANCGMRVAPTREGACPSCRSPML